MESFTEQLNLLDVPAEICKDIILFYQHCTSSSASEICKTECSIDEMKHAIIKSLITKPYETSCIVQQLQDVFKASHSSSMENIFSSAVINYLQQFTEDTQNELDVKNVYTLLSLIEFSDQNDNILDFIFTEIYDLIEKGKLNKDLVYMTLLPQRNLEIINRLLKYERDHFNKCNLKDTTTLFRYCLYKNRHWLFHIIESESPDANLIESNILHKIWLLKIIYSTNDGRSLDFENIEAAINKISRNDIRDTFLEFYLLEIKWNLELYRYLSKINNTIIPKNDFKLSNVQSCLQTISSYIDLREIDKYKEINDILVKYEKYTSELQNLKSQCKLNANSETNSELDLYNGYSLLLIITRHISENCDKNLDQNELLKIIKTQLFQSENVEFQLEILENTFALLFLQYKHINKPDVENKDAFLCGHKEVHSIATFLKRCLKELKRKHFSGGTTDKSSKCYLRFTNLTSYINDALWRFELVKVENFSETFTCNIVNIMLASPNTLIHLCLENGNFEKAHEVVQVFKMRNTHIAQEIDFMEKMQYLKSEKTNNPIEIIEFCKETKTIEDKDYKETFDKYKENDIIKHLTTENEIFINTMDIALTYGDTFEISKQLFEAVVEMKTLDEQNSCSYLQFCHNVLQVFNEIGARENLSASQVLNNAKYPLNLTKLFDKLGFYNRLESIYNHFQTEHSQNNKHLCNNIFVDLNKICIGKNKEVIENMESYLEKLYNYLKLLSQIIFVKEDANDILSDDENSCFFAWMTKNTAEIVGKLISQRAVKPRDLEPLFSRLKLDLVYHIAWNCLPLVELKSTNNKDNETIIISYENKTFSQFLNDLKQIYCDTNISEINLINPDVFLLSYIRKRNWLLAYLINKVYLIEEAKPDTNSERTKYFNNLINLESVRNLKVLFNNNAAATVLYQVIDINTLLQFIINTVNQDGDDSIDWQHILDIIDSLPERTLHSEINLIRLKDNVLYNLISNSKMIEDVIKYVEYIYDDKLRIKCIFENFNDWPGEVCIEVLNSQLTRRKLDEKYQEKIRKWFYQIELYENIKCTYELESWNEIYTKSTEDPISIFLLLLTSKQILLLLKWIDVHKPISTDLLHLIDINYFNLIFNEGIDLAQVKILLDLLQFEHRIQICKELIKHIRRLEYLEFIIHYLISLLPELESEYKNVTISLQMFSCFNATEHDFMYCLVNKPLLIIEQLLMNTRLEKLNVVLEKIAPYLNCVSDKNMADDVSEENIDNLLRTYAMRALDFRGIQSSACLKTMELKLMQSLDTVSDDSVRKAFVMPNAVPDKENWIQNDEAVECMCCRDVTFSMFNRRHHCRRCGRVICGSCSHKRMEIAEYGSIPVRVCNECHKQSQDPNASMKSDRSSNKSGSLNCWLLTDDDGHNDIAREEFSYEYAPSVSLCLSILKLHSTSVEYPRFLLNQCKVLLPFLQDADSEIDYSFLIQMIKSLITVAKITSLTHSFKAELSQCNDMLIHIELLRLLIEKDCLELFRSTNKTVTGEYIDSGALRRLRDKLLEQEHWHLALEVSTKAGLDKTGVFAAWGKSCLKSGCLQLAREKFQYCLERSTLYETSLDFSVSFDYPDSAKSSRLRSANFSTLSENRAAKTPPLVNEIISVLESNSKITDKTVMKTFEPISLSSSTLSLNTTASLSYDPAICILNKLKNLKHIVESGPSRSRKNSRASSVDRTDVRNYYMDPCFYNECLYYLMRYAAHGTILQFYMRHEEMDEALNYLLENRLPTDVFIEVYMKCLEDGKIELFQEHMQNIDSSLNMWEVYLKSICRHLETNAMYNVLYQLQLFMCDYVRAAMTCIKFYQDNANSFRELLDREDYLHRAQAHLKQELEQEQWVQVRAVRKTSTTSSGSSHSVGSNQPSLLMKIDPRNIDRYINTIWRQIEVAKFLAECEIDDRPTLDVLNEIFTFGEEEKPPTQKARIPTLFDSQLDKTKLAVLAVVCGKNIEEGFGIAFRIVQDHKLKFLKIYCLAGKYLAQILRETAVIELVSCIKSSGLNMEAVCSTCDEVLLVSVCALAKANATGMQLENLIRLMSDVAMKINAYIESRQLKRAYLLAIRHNRNNDVRKILREAERQNQPQIRAICLKRLNQTK